MEARPGIFSFVLETPREAHVSLFSLEGATDRGSHVFFSFHRAMHASKATGLGN